jgi:hypothetical protein
VDALGQFELDTHVEVVLFGFQNEMSALVEHSLNQLSGLQSSKRGIKYTQEKLIFRVFSSPIPVNFDQQFKNDTDIIENLTSQLELHHLKSASKTTLFVLNIMTDSTIFATFPPTFVSQFGFAFINLNRLGDLAFVSSQEVDYLSTEFLSSSLLKSDDTSKLSVLIYRCLEQLVPEVRPGASSVPRFVHSRVFLLCGFPLKKCIPDVQLTSVLELLSHSLGGSSSIHFQYSVSVISVTNSVPLTHALLSSVAKYSSTWNHNKHASSGTAKLGVFSPNRLIELLLQSDEISELLAKDSSSIPNYGKLIPIVSLLLPDDVDAFFPPPSTYPLHSWYDSPILSASSNSKAIFFLHPCSSGPEPSRHSLKRLIQYGTNVRSRSNATVKRSIGFESRDIFDKILEFVWQIPPSTVSFSSSSHQFIEDHLWFEAYRRSINTFRDMRAIHRQLIIQTTEQLLARASSSLIYHQATHESSKIFEASPLLSKTFESILQDFDKAASDFSHLDYDLALKELDRIEIKISEIEEIMLTSPPLPNGGRPYLSCRTFETEDLTDITTFPINSVFRMSSLFVGLLMGFLFVATFFRSVESRKGIRRVIR